MQVAVIGPGDEATASDRRHAYEVGRLLADAGAIVITGGLGGVMAEAARGCFEAGGTAVGLLPGSGGGNEHLTVALPTGMGEMRNPLLVRCADGVIAIGGSWGTLSEVALAQRTGVPLVGLDGWQIATADGTPVALDVAPTPAAAVELITARIADAPGSPLGNVSTMTEPPDDERVESRRQLLPEEMAAGSDDPDLQAEVILEDSDERTERPEETKHQSVQTPE